MTDNHIYTGDADELAITVTDEDGDPVDLLNTTVTWAIARNAHTDALIEKDTDGDVTIVDAAAGELNVDIEPADTRDLRPRTYYHEVELRDQDGDPTTVELDDLEIRQAVIQDDA